MTIKPGETIVLPPGHNTPFILPITGETKISGDGPFAGGSIGMCEYLAPDEFAIQDAKGNFHIFDSKGNKRA